MVDEEKLESCKDDLMWLPCKKKLNRLRQQGEQGEKVVEDIWQTAPQLPLWEDSESFYTPD